MATPFAALCNCLARCQRSRRRRRRLAAQANQVGLLRSTLRSQASYHESGKKSPTDIYVTAASELAQSDIHIPYVYVLACLLGTWSAAAAPRRYAAGWQVITVRSYHGPDRHTHDTHTGAPGRGRETERRASEENAAVSLCAHTQVACETWHIRARVSAGNMECRPTTTPRSLVWTGALVYGQSAVASRGVRTGDYWLGMVGNDGSTVGVAIVSGLGSRYELY